MTNPVSSPLKAIAIVVGLLCANPTFASSTASSTCDPELAQAAAQGQQKQLEAEIQRATNLYKDHNKQPDWLKDSDGLLTACTSNNWPTLKVSQPVLQSILSKSQEKATKAACNKARSIISEATGNAKDVLSGIPGYSNLASSSSNLGSWGDIGQLATDNLPGISNTGVSWNDLGLGNTGSSSSVGTGSSTGSGSSASIPGISNINP